MEQINQSEFNIDGTSINEVNSESILDDIKELLGAQKQRVGAMEEQTFGQPHEGSLRDRASKLGEYLGYSVTK